MPALPLGCGSLNKPTSVQIKHGHSSLSLVSGHDGVCSVFPHVQGSYQEVITPDPGEECVLSVLFPPYLSQAHLSVFYPDSRPVSVCVHLPLKSQSSSDTNPTQNARSSVRPQHDASQSVHVHRSRAFEPFYLASYGGSIADPRPGFNQTLGQSRCLQWRPQCSSKGIYHLESGEQSRHVLGWIRVHRPQ